MKLRIPGKSERRLAAAILVVAIIPLVTAIFLASSLFSQATAIWFNPEVGQQLDRGVLVYKDYVNAVKDDMRHQTDAVAADESLREAAHEGDGAAVAAALDRLFPHYPELVSLAVQGPDGNEVGRHDRGRPVDETKERKLDVVRALGDGADAPLLRATFAVDRKRIDELATTGPVVTRYHQLEKSRSQVYDAYVRAFAALAGITMLLALAVGIVLARGVTRRINRLHAAIDVVAKGGDLSVRVPVTGSDELTELARTFNGMLGEMAASRARIEYLQRVGAWQEMAQRLAHEIKNPLTPIQLAVQECHRKYPGDDPKYRALLDTTLEVVEEEVGTLRRLVGDFSSFARLPNADLRDADLTDFLQDCKDQLVHMEDVADSVEEAPLPDGEAPAISGAAIVEWDEPDGPLAAAIDRQMLRRVLVNLVRNAVQALRDARAGDDSAAPGHVRVHAAADGAGSAITVEDDGPGIPEATRERIFDPYFTTKVDGTGLGLAIVKKIVVDHGGSIEVDRSPDLGGARFVIHLPAPRSLEIEAARQARARAREAGVATA